MPRINDPAYLNPADWLCQGPKMAPFFTLPDGRSIALFIKRDDVNPNDAVGRGGIRYIRNNETADANRFRWMESKQMFGGTSSANYPGEEISAQDWKSRAGSEWQWGVSIDEFMEGQRRMRTDSDQYKAFTAEITRLQLAAGRTRSHFMCYGNFDMPRARDWKYQGVYKGPTDPMFVGNYDSQNAARGAMSNYFNQGHYANCWPSVKYYPESPSTQADYFQRVYEMEMLAKALNPGDRWGFVTAPLIESLPDTVQREGGDSHIGVSTARRVSNPPGKVITTPHPHYDYDLAKALHLAALDRCTDILGWDSPLAYGTNPQTVYQPVSGDSIQSQWVPDVAGTPPPYAQSGRGYPPERLNFYDMIYAAAHLYNEMRATAGVSFAHLSYKVNSGAFTSLQANGSDVLFHDNARRGECRGRVKNGAASFYYYNPYLGKHLAETVTIRVGGKEFTYTLQGGVVHAFNESVA